MFSGDTLFIGDCGSPDLRGTGKDMDVQRDRLKAKMYDSRRNKLLPLPDVILYPAHGAGTLCGKAQSDASSSSMGSKREKIGLYSP